jgi:hypothetical protein
MTTDDPGKRQGAALGRLSFCLTNCVTDVAMRSASGQADIKAIAPNYPPAQLLYAYAIENVACCYVTSVILPPKGAAPDNQKSAPRRMRRLGIDRGILKHVYVRPFAP